MLPIQDTATHCYGQPVHPTPTVQTAVCPHSGRSVPAPIYSWSQSIRLPLAFISNQRDEIVVSLRCGRMQQVEAGGVRRKDLPEGKTGIKEKVVPSHHTQNNSEERTQEDNDCREEPKVIDMPGCAIEKNYDMDYRRTPNILLNGKQATQR